MIRLDVTDGVAEVTVAHPKPQNPFSMEMTRHLTSLCAELDADDAVRGVLFWGGEGRSFSVGGDFEDVRELRDEPALQKYAHEILASYRALLGVGKPLVAAVDHFAIGLGLQVALMSDWIVGTERSTYHMPELAAGIACPMGSTILEHLLGRSAMLEIVNGCHGLTAKEARHVGMIQEIVPHSSLRDAALARLAKLLEYPALPFRLTKELHNARFDRVLEELEAPAARIHWACFREKLAAKHFDRVLGKGS